MPSIRELLQGKVSEEKLIELEVIEAKLTAQNRLVETLNQDIGAAIKLVRENPNNHFFRRTLIRTIFAMIEGAIYAMKQMILLQHNNKKFELTPAEHAILIEEGYELKENGQPKASVKFLKLAANLRFTLSIFAKNLTSLEYKFDATSHGWVNLLKSIDIRNRITHPKQDTDLLITDDEFGNALSASTWFSASFQELMEAGADYSKRETMKDIFSKLTKSPSKPD